MADQPTLDPTASTSSTASIVSTDASSFSLSTVTDAVSGAVSSLNSFFKKLSVKLPLPNPLFAYASYDYILGLGMLSMNEINNPDTTYMAGKSVHLVAKDANIDPNNRVNTSYGKFDFFINNLTLKSVIGFERNHNTNVLTATFEIIEPYSMGLFFISCQQLATQLGYSNWREAPFLLTIDFRGNKETGTMSTIPNTSRKIPVRIITMDMTAGPEGCKYLCKAIVWGQQGHTDTVKKFKTDVSAQGSTVQEILQTGVNSVQVAMNKFYKQQADDLGLDYADECVIYFPQVQASATSTPASGGGIFDSNVVNIGNSPTLTGANFTSSDSIFKNLGVSRSTINATLVQDDGAANEIGQATLGMNEQKKADVVFNGDNAVYDSKSGNFFQFNAAKQDTTKTQIKFHQDHDVIMAINAAVFQSDYIKKSLNASNIDENGFRNWWRVETQTFFLQGELNVKNGQYAKLHAFKVVPYKVHNSKVNAGGVKPRGYTGLTTQAAKVYNYLYTGKNVDVLDFKINFKVSFLTMLSAQSPSKSMDAQNTASQGGTDKQQSNPNPLPKGEAPDGSIGTTMLSFAKRLLSTDLQGGGGLESAQTRSAKEFHDVVTKGVELLALRLKIIGDPYWIVQSGTGNYSSAASQYKNVNNDQTVNWQNGEVDCLVNFRTPVDLNQSTGLYNFGGSSKSAPVNHYSGLYHIIVVTSNFSDGLFTQELKGVRRPLYESKKAEATPENTYNISNSTPNKKDPDNTNG